MSRDDGNDALRNEWYELGTITGLRQASTILFDKAAEQFARGLDANAILLRDLARGLELTADGRKALHEQRYPKSASVNRGTKGTP